MHASCLEISNKHVYTCVKETYNSGVELLVVIHGEDVAAASLVEVVVVEHLSLQVEHLCGG